MRHLHNSRERQWSETWHRRFMDLAHHVAHWSKDRSRQVGCVIVGPGREIRSLGYNGFPRGVDDRDEMRHVRPAKYWWTEHAERNAIYNAARSGAALEDCTAYVPFFPCADCARALIQVGISLVVAYAPYFEDPQYGEQFRVAEQMLIEAGVALHYLPGDPPQSKG